MGRYFAVMAGVAMLMALLSGTVIYALTADTVEQTKYQAGKVLLKSLAANLSAQTDWLVRSVAQMADDPQLAVLAASGDRLRSRDYVRAWESHLAGLQRLRVLWPEDNTPDGSERPELGFADLDMARETFTQNQPPRVQGDGDNRHLAIARPIRYQDKIVAVLLASFDYRFLQPALNIADAQAGYFELQQQQFVLAQSGDSALKIENVDTEKQELAGTVWAIQYWPPAPSQLLDFVLPVSAVSVCALLAGLAFLIGYRRVTMRLCEDRTSVLKAIKDMMTGHIRGNYPVHFDEMRVIIPTMIQFKRVIDKTDESSGEAWDSEMSLDLSDFFSETPAGVTDDDDKPATHLPMVSPRMTKMDDQFSTSAQANATARPVSLPRNRADHNESVANLAVSLNTPAVNDAKATIFRAYDIRGIVGKTLTKEMVYDIGRAFGSEAQALHVDTIVIGRDGRHSSEGLAEALAKGILTTGCNVLDIGLVPTPVLYFVAHHHASRSGIMITGSHNPAEYNGLKMVLHGETLATEKIQRLRQRVEAQDFIKANEGQWQRNERYVNEYLGTIADDVHLVRPMKIAVDCGNGAAGQIAPLLLKTIGCEVIELFCEIDGDFPNHHPDPSQPENLRELITAVKHYQAEVGIAFDGDGDRLGVVDAQGKIIWPDRQMMLFAKDILRHKPGAEIIYDVKCSRHLAQQIKKLGGRPLMWKTGHSLIKAKLKETQAKLAGEMSGHLFFNDRWFGFDDALYAAARLIEILSADSRTSDLVFADFPDSVNTPELNVTLAEGEHFAFVEELKTRAQFNDAVLIDIDGLRVEFADGWGLVRASNTTPSLVIRFEADNQAALQRIQQQFKTLILQIKPGLALPF